MPTLTIRNFPAVLCQRLGERATTNRRSINAEAIACLKQVLGETRLGADAFLAEVRELRRSATKCWVTDDDLKKGKNEGRL